MFPGFFTNKTFPGLFRVCIKSGKNSAV